jgi:hypothetical protein
VCFSSLSFFLFFYKKAGNARFFIVFLGNY